MFEEHEQLCGAVGELFCAVVEWLVWDVCGLLEYRIEQVI